MIIGSLNENVNLEKRVAITPEVIKKYKSLGFEIFLSKNYGTHLGFSSEDFEKEGMNFSTPMKDSKFITELSRENLVALPIYQVALQYYYSAVANGFGKKDASSVIKIIERNANFSR